MRTNREVLERFHELRTDRLRRRKEQFLSQIPRNCQFNTRMRVKGQGMVGFCQNPIVLRQARTKVFVCNDEATAERCRVFNCRNTHKSVEDDFEEIMKSPARCGNDYPKLAMLIWFLQNYPSTGRAARFKYDLGKIFSGLFRVILFRWW